MQDDSNNDPPLLRKLNNYGNSGRKHPIRGEDIGEIVSGYELLINLLPISNRYAVLEPIGMTSGVEREPLTHKRLQKFISIDFDLHKFGIPFGARVGVLIPNGPELAVCLIGVVSKWCAAPINPANTWQEIKAELESIGVQAIIVQAGFANEGALYAAGSLSIGVLELQASEDTCGLFTLNVVNKMKVNVATPCYRVAKTVKGFISYDHPETVLLLHTSGTSGAKKLVPYSLDMIIVGVGCIVSSWNLSPDDICLNMMPLFHIGGIIRNVFAPILSGGAVIACGGFDPVLFWDVLSLQRVTSYYAAPTMHHAILMEGERRSKPLPVSTMRYIANAAGGLLPVLADSLKRTFPSAVILTSYGMTECMPIASPPQYYAMDPIGTSGTIVGPDVLIADDDQHQLPARCTGNIMIRGPPTFGGYENNTAATDESFWTIDGSEGWFNTGDMGYLDENGYLFVSGRSKEIINRGGETISPFEIEEAVVKHPQVKETLAFSAPHDDYQETVGAVIVTQPNMPRVDLYTLHKYLDDKLHRSKWPQILIYMTALPKNAANKILRIKLGERLQLTSVNEESAMTSRLYEAECPPVGTPLTEKIPMCPVTLQPSTITEVIMADKRGGVSHAVVLMMELPVRKVCFAACVTPASADTEAVMAACKDRLHSYFVPAFICAVDRIPTKTLNPHVAVVGTTTTPPTSATSTHITAPPTAIGTTTGVIMEEGFIGCYDETMISVAGYSKRQQASLDFDALETMIASKFMASNVVGPRDELEAIIEVIWRNYLQSQGSVDLFNASSTSSFSSSFSSSSSAGGVAAGVATAKSGRGGAATISVLDSFFDLGGDSLKAGQLINAMRKQLRIQGLSVPDLFANPTIATMAKRATALGYDPLKPVEMATVGSSDSRGGRNSKKMREKMFDSDRFTHHEDLHGPGLDWWIPDYSTSSTSWSCLIIQLLPLAIIYPIRKMSAWFFVAQPWVLLMNVGVDRIIALVLSMIIARVLLGIIAPLIAIVCKWVLIGRYKPGRYPLWGSMYLRWWLVEQIINIMGKGFFNGDLPIIGELTLKQYYRWMGASIGKNVKISKGAHLGQPDLLTIDDDVVLDAAIIRPFSLEKNHFVLLPIVIGRRSTIGAKSTVAAGAIIPPDTHLGPLSSSHELEDSSVENKKYCRPLMTGPPYHLVCFVGVPILVLVAFVSYLPWYTVIVYMESNARRYGWYMEEIHSIFDAFAWWVTLRRLPYYFLLRILRRCVVPPVKLIAVIFVKRFFIGTFTQCEKAEMELPWNRFRYWLMANLTPGSDLCGVAPLCGRHYEIISIIYRLLGAKVGERVYWPGSGFDIVEYDLINIGDDVVFGSRSIMMTRSTERAAAIVIEANAMLADRCVVLPGVHMRQGSVIGSGGLGGESREYAAGSVWVGSQGGNAVNVLPEDISIKGLKSHSPFGRAFYDRSSTTYFVYPLWLVVLYNTLWHMFCACYHNLPPVLAIYASMYIGNVDRNSWIDEVIKIVLLYCVPVYCATMLVALLVEITAKWLILGRRTVGMFSWDSSSYCQRWQLYLTIQEIRRGESGDVGILELLQGSQYLVWYFRSLGGTIGQEVCLYPNGGDPMMTEPDLVSIGDFSAVDDASLIAHINTRGIFTLNRVTVGHGCVLKSNSRLLSGATMENHSILKEHTLILAGDSVDSCSVWQGWPSKTHCTIHVHQQELMEMLARYGDTPAQSGILDKFIIQVYRIFCCKRGRRTFRRSSQDEYDDGDDEDEKIVVLVVDENTRLLSAPEHRKQITSNPRVHTRIAGVWGDQRISRSRSDDSKSSELESVSGLL